MKICSVEGCERQDRMVRGMCRMHYKRFMRKGHVELEPVTYDCSVEGCDKPHNSKGFCANHLRKFKRWGDPTAGINITHYPSPEEGLAARSEPSGGGCINWTGAVDHTGYGRINTRSGSVAAHRFAWEHANGEQIPEGMVIDHICFNRTCVNPAHLRVVTQKQNSEHLSGPSKRSTSGIRGVYWNKASNSWNVRIGHNRKCYYFGSFADKEQAAEVARLKRIELFTHNDLDRVAA